MARINVEDDILRDTRFQALVRFHAGEIDRALGQLVRFWWAAQHHWGKGSGLVPRNEFDIGDFKGLLDVGLAEECDGGDIYARGAKEHFEWYRQRIEAAKRGGIKSAAARRASGSAVPKKASNTPKQNRSTGSDLVEANPKQTRSDAEAKPNPLTLTLQSNLVTRDPTEPPGSAVWAAYSGAYLGRYKVPPVRNAKSNGMCAQLVKRLGIDAAIGVVRFYLSHQGAYYVTKAHALGPCLADCEALHTQMLNGMTITRASASHADKNAANQAAFTEVAKAWADRKKGGPDGQ